MRVDQSGSYSVLGLVMVHITHERAFDFVSSYGFRYGLITPASFTIILQASPDHSNICVVSASVTLHAAIWLTILLEPTMLGRLVVVAARAASAASRRATGGTTSLATLLTGLGRVDFAVSELCSFMVSQ